MGNEKCASGGMSVLRWLRRKNDEFSRCGLYRCAFIVILTDEKKFLLAFYLFTLNICML